MLSKYDKLSIQRNPYREYSKPLKPKYNNSKYHQLRIYFQCESEYFKTKSKRKMNNVGLEVVFWTILSLYLLTKFGVFKKK